jgi:hypothetical protein
MTTPDRPTPEEPRVVAAFASLESARSAVVALERAGVEAGAIETHGPEHRATELTRAREERGLRHAGVRLGVGLAAGTVVGALAGLVIAFAVGRAGILAVVACTLAGLALGALVAGMGSLDADPDAELAFARAEEPPVLLEVRGDRELRDRAVDLLRGREPLALTVVERSDEDRRSA